MATAANDISNTISSKSPQCTFNISLLEDTVEERVALKISVL